MITEEKNGCWSCGWIVEGRKVWSCTCGCIWNPFDTDGICPICKLTWDYIQCPGCAFPRHKYSYDRKKLNTIYCRSSSVRNCEDRPVLPNNSHGPAFETMLDEVWKWIDYFDQKTDQKPKAVLNAEKSGLLSAPEYFEPTHSIMKQIIQGKGIKPDNPIHSDIIIGLELLIYLIPYLKMIECSEISHHKEEGMIIQQYRFKSKFIKDAVTLFRSKHTYL